MLVLLAVVHMLVASYMQSSMVMHEAPAIATEASAQSASSNLKKEHKQE